MRSFLVTDAIRDYAASHSTWPADDTVRDLQSRTRALGGASGMQIADDQGQLLTLLTRLVGARSAVEVGTFTGYSSLCIARGLADGGRLVCCDISEEWTAIGQTAWEAAGVRDRIDLRIAPALETLRALPDEASIDVAFIDADKGGYIGYWDELVPRMRPGGLLLADNVLWSGEIVDDASSGSDLAALQSFNDHVVADDRVEVALLTAFDGLTIARRL